MIKNFHLLILFYLVLLLQHAWVPGFFQDGYLYAELGKNAANGDWLVPHLNDNTYAEFFHHLPFVFMLEGLFFKVFGASFLTARVFASLFSLLTLTTLFFWIRKEKGEKLAFLTGAIFTLILPLIKKSRFPNLDLPLLLFTLLSFRFYFEAYKENKQLKSWLLCGTFFGLALLTKGPIGMLIPFAIFWHLLISKEWRRLKSLPAWTGLALGFLIFSIWPLLLQLNGKFYIFTQWFDFTFKHTIVDGRGSPTTPLIYVIFLLKQAAPWLLLSLASIYFYRKKKVRDPLYLLFVTIFFGYLIILSIPRFKYSHYIIPLYPAMAFLAAYPLQNMSEKIFNRTKMAYLSLALVVSLSLLIFPLTNETRRDSEIYKLKGIFETTQTQPKSWMIVDGVYPFWSLNNLVSWHDLGEVKNISTSDLQFLFNGIPKKTVILISSKTWKNVKNQYGDSLDELMKFKKYNLVVVITKDILGDGFLFTEK